jgi:hypothetical protein
LDWPEIIAEGFPGPRDGEPPSLRRDIADELNDHLACAMQRELRRTDDPAIAEHAVLNCFGNPKRVARQLWWDAMKEQIMKDRIMIGMMVLTLVICAAVGFFAWRMMQQGQQVNQAILAKLAELNMPGKPVAQPEVPANWSKVTFRCFEGDGQNKPAAKLKITISGKPFSDSEQRERIVQVTDDQGLTTFGPIRPGQYDLTIEIPGYEGQRREVALYANQASEQIINVPPSERDAGVSLKVNWPDDLKKMGLLLYCRILAHQLKLGDLQWTAIGQSVTIAPDGGLFRDYWRESWLREPERGDMRGEGPGEGRGGPFAESTVSFFPRQPNSQRERLALVAPAGEPMKAKDRFACVPGRYRIDPISVMYPVSDPNNPTLRGLEVAPDYDPGSEEAPSFDARAGQSNTWTINLPEELLRQVREGIQQSMPTDTLTDVELRVTWPADLADMRLPLFCHFTPDEKAPQSNANPWWSINDWEGIVLADGQWLEGWPTWAWDPGQRSWANGRRLDMLSMGRVNDPKAWESRLETRARRPATTYRLVSIATGRSMNNRPPWRYSVTWESPTLAQAPVFVAEPGKVNSWTITPPGELLNRVREYLARESQPASEPATSPPRSRR